MRLGSTSLELTFFYLDCLQDKTRVEAFLEVLPKSLQAPTLRGLQVSPLPARA